MWFKLLYAGFETCFGWDHPAAKVLGSDSKKPHLEARCCTIVMYTV